MKRLIRSNRWLICAIAALATASALPAAAAPRSLADFLSRQETWCAVFTDQGIDCAASHYGGPICGPDESSFTFPQFWTDPKNGFTAAIDALGQLDPGSFGTIVQGSVSESARPDGLADVKVVLHTSNALTRAVDADFDLIFGYARGEVELGAPPTLGDATVQLAFTNTAPGAPLPDYAQLQICPAPGQALERISIRAQASGPLRAASGFPEGTPGRLEVTQNGLFGTALKANPRSRVALDAFPAEHVIVRAVGH